MLLIDGAIGEGGGQILRTSLALSLCLQRPFSIRNIRVKRRRPGLSWQHLAAVNAAARISRAEVEGAVHRSTELTFIPHTVQGGKYMFDIGTAGSTSLVLQTVVPSLLFAQKPSELIVKGGTHNPHAPSFDYLHKVFFPILRKMGAQITARLIRPGFYPSGGGVVNVRIQPCTSLSPLTLKERGTLLKKTAIARVAGLPSHIGRRELTTIQQELGFSDEELFLEQLAPKHGPGNVVLIVIQSEHVKELFTGYGEMHVRAETVARRAAAEARQYIQAGVPVGCRLADQLLVPIALAGKSCYVTQPPTSHTRTNIEVIQQFMGDRISTKELATGAWRVRVD